MARQPALPVMIPAEGSPARPRSPPVMTPMATWSKTELPPLPTYDGLNRLAKVEKAGATVATYGDDSSNRLIAETLVDGTVLREYIYLNSESLVLKGNQTNPGIYYFITAVS